MLVVVVVVARSREGIVSLALAEVAQVSQDAGGLVASVVEITSGPFRILISVRPLRPAQASARASDAETGRRPAVSRMKPCRCDCSQRPAGWASGEALDLNMGGAYAGGHFAVTAYTSQYHCRLALYCVGPIPQLSISQTSVSRFANCMSDHAFWPPNACALSENHFSPSPSSSAPSILTSPS